jgi:hypothetical protein
MPRSTKRRHLLADEQLRILKVAPKPHIRIAELCCCQGIGIILPYAWREEAGQRATRATSQPKRRQGQTGTHAIAEWPWLRPFLLTLTGCVAHPIHALPIVPRDHGETLPCNAPSFTGLRCKWFPTIVRDPSSYFQDFVDCRNDVVQFHLG